MAGSSPPGKGACVDGERFDALIRRLCSDASRRGVLRAGAIALAAAVAAVDLTAISDAEAKRKKKKKKKTVLCLNGQTIRVSKKRKNALLRQGATLGVCSTSTTTTLAPSTTTRGPCTTTTRAPLPPGDFLDRCGIGYKVCDSSSLGCCVAGHECCPPNTGIDGCCGIGYKCCPPRDSCSAGYCATWCG